MRSDAYVICTDYQLLHSKYLLNAMYRMVFAEMAIAIAVTMVSLPVVGPIIAQPAKADDDYSEPQCYVFCGGSTFSLHLGFGFHGHHHDYIPFLFPESCIVLYHRDLQERMSYPNMGIYSV
jgi:hypothetical protein